MSGRFLNSLSHLIIAIKIKYVSDKIKGILVVLNLRVEAGKVESIG